jgi:2-methylaconitate cis-trans-isomerase PrpF
MLPTGNLREEIDGVEVTCMDVAMPIMIARAADFGLTGHETAADIDANAALLARLEPMRLEAGRRMGLGDVAKSVTPKIALLAPPRAGGNLAARYLMPWACHPSMAVTGAQCIAACLLTPGTVAEGLGTGLTGRSPELITLEHPSGAIEVAMTFDTNGNSVTIRAAGLVRTARLLARGEVMVPASVWSR